MRHRLLCFSLFAALNLAAWGTVLAGAPGPRDEEPQLRRAAGKADLFEGLSKKGNLQEALDEAVASALRSLPGADRRVRYRLREISGVRGGIAGENTVRVVVEMTGE